MKWIYGLFQVIIILFYAENLIAQQLFKDSGQSLGSSYSTSVKLGDLDGDGDMDAAVANPSRPVSQNNEIWLNDGKGNFTMKPQKLGSSTEVTLFDIDQDGDLDLFENESWAQNGNPIRTWLNDGHANFTRSDKYDFEGVGIAFCKMSEEDTEYKAITIESSGISEIDRTILRIYSFDNSSCKLENRLEFRNFGGTGIASGDLNGDGFCDLVMYRIQSAYILLNDKKGGFLKSDQELPDENHTLLVVLKDFNGDGKLDILQSNYHGFDGLIRIVNLYLNDGSGRFTKASLPYNSHYLTTSVAVADMDNDGDQDIYINHGNQIPENVHRSEILLNDGRANFTSTPALSNIQSMLIAFGDLDNDGDLDMFLACGSVTGNTVGNRVWLNTTIDDDN